MDVERTIELLLKNQARMDARFDAKFAKAELRSAKAEARLDRLERVVRQNNRFVAGLERCGNGRRIDRTLARVGKHLDAMALRRAEADKNGGDPESEARFKEVTLAYETLRDPERRRRYDMFGTNDPGGPQMGDVFGAGLGDLFESFFGGQRFGGGRQSGPRRGEEV